MEYLSPGPHLSRRLPPTNYQRTLYDMDIEHAARVRQQLEQVGVGYWGITSPEAHHLPYVIHHEEQINGAVYGRGRAGFVMLVATDRRVIYLDKKPLFTNEEEITYDAVNGISHGHSGVGSVITLNTRIKDYRIKTLNERCTNTFVEAIEKQCVEHLRDGKGGRYDNGRSRRRL